MINPDLNSPSYASTATMMSVRPQHDPYRSLPNTPIGMDPRNVSMDMNSAMNSAMNHARLGLEVQDYFSGSPRFSGSMRPRSPYPHDYETESGVYTSNSSFAVSDMNPVNLAALVNRTNLAVTLVNAQISSTAKYGKVFPHMNDDGAYPTDFSTPKTVEAMRVLDNSQLDRIMQTYRLPLDLRSVAPSASSSSRPSSPWRGDAPISSSRARQAKLHSLWEFLGCWKLVEHERLKRAGY